MTSLLHHYPFVLSHTGPMATTSARYNLWTSFFIHLISAQSIRATSFEWSAVTTCSDIQSPTACKHWTTIVLSISLQEPQRTRMQYKRVWRMDVALVTTTDGRVNVWWLLMSGLNEKSTNRQYEFFDHKYVHRPRRFRTLYIVMLTYFCILKGIY